MKKRERKRIIKFLKENFDYRCDWYTGLHTFDVNSIDAIKDVLKNKFNTYTSEVFGNESLQIAYFLDVVGIVTEVFDCSGRITEKCFPGNYISFYYDDNKKIKKIVTDKSDGIITRHILNYDDELIEEEIYENSEYKEENFKEGIIKLIAQNNSSEQIEKIIPDIKSELIKKILKNE